MFIAAKNDNRYIQKLNVLLSYIQVYEYKNQPIP